MVRVDKITGLTPLNYFNRTFFYEENRDTPLNFGNKCILRHRPEIFVAIKKSQDQF